MDILILYDSTATDDNGVNWLSLLLESVDPTHCVQTVLLDCKDIRACVGCFGCWTKTPGRCGIADDAANSIVSAYIQADTVMLLSHVTYGGYSPDIKAFLDRSIGSLLPFFILKNGEMHHQKRYAKYPALVAFGYGDMTGAEQKTFLELSTRNALNLHSPEHIAFAVRTPDEAAQAVRDVRIFLEKEAA
jgi:multimeric flavodoxin WrbA